MYFIALCDDEESELDRIEELLADYRDSNREWEYETQRFLCVEALLLQLRQAYKPDLVLLDICMPGKSGIEAAQEIRGMGEEMPIVFLTSSREYALNAYEVDALQYLVKPLGRERFFHAMDSVMRLYQKAGQGWINMKVAGGICRVRPDDIIYCESQKNYQVLYLTEGERKIRMTARSLWEILEDFTQFAKCGRSYILNMNHILSMDREEIVMNNGRKIYIPYNKTAEFRENYFSYYFDGKEDAGYGLF